jgi:transcriptional regulator with XRE-family HTH domain
MHVGQQLRRRRLLLGLSQSEVAASLQVTFQQVQKYERGTSRINASRLYELALALKVPVDYFFDGLVGRRDDSLDGFLADEVQDRQAMQFLRYFHAIPVAEHRSEFLELVRALANGKG